MMQVPAWAVWLDVPRAPDGSPVRHRVLYGGRGGAKSWTIASKLIERAQVRPLRILALREIQNLIRDSSKLLLEDVIDRLGFGAGGDKFFTVTRREIRGRNGAKITFIGLTGKESTIKSFEGIDLVWVEEAAAVSQASIDALIPTIRKPRSEIWWSGHPRVGNWVQQEPREDGAGPSTRSDGLDGRFSMAWPGSVKRNAPAGKRAIVGERHARARKPASPFHCFNSSPEVIRLVVLMYVRFPLSLRNVEDLLFERGIDVRHETVRLWWNRFDPMFAGEIRRQRVSRMRGFRHWRWHLDEMSVKLNGEMVYLWRAVDHEGEILESYVTRTRDKGAALAFTKKTPKRHGSPERITTDGLRSYGAAMDDLGNRDKQEVGRWANNRVENSHLPFRRRERAMARFGRTSSLQKFASVHANLHNHFSLERHLVDRTTFKERRSAAPAERQLIAS